MTTWWRKAFNSMKYVTQEHFDRTIVALRADLETIFVSKREFHDTLDQLRSDLTGKMDTMLEILQKLDIEQHSITARLDRHETDIKCIKQHLKLA